MFLIISMFVFLVIKSFMSNILFQKKEEPLKNMELNSSIFDSVNSKSLIKLLFKILI